MNNLSEAFASMGRVDEAKQWAERGLELAENPNTAKIDKDAPVCNETYGVLLYNMGILLEVGFLTGKVFLFVTDLSLSSTVNNSKRMTRMAPLHTMKRPATTAVSTNS